MVKGKGGNFREAVVEEAKKQGVKVRESLSMAEQERLLKEDGAPTPDVQGDKMLAKFVRPHFDMDEDDRVVELEFSIALSDAHKKLLDPEILECWKFMERRHAARMGIVNIDIPQQTIDLYDAPDDKRKLRLAGVPITGAKISFVERTGDGKTEKITRLQFRAVCGVTMPDPRDKENAIVFAVTNYGRACWLKMSAAQGELKMAAGA